VASLIWLLTLVAAIAYTVAEWLGKH
jgi:hypothetical protein